jgi:cytochrome P450
MKDWLEYPRVRPLLVRFRKEFKSVMSAVEILGLVAGHGLLTTTGEDHKQLRKAMTPAFYLKLDGPCVSPWF